MLNKNISAVASALLLSTLSSASLAAIPQGYKITELNIGAGTSSTASALNDLGQVVGSFRPAVGPGEEQAFVSSGVSTAIAPLAGYTASQAFGINNAGVVVGRSFSSGRFAPSTGFSYDGTLSEVGSAAFPITRVDDINNSGDIVSYYSPFLGQAQTFLQSGGVTTDIGTLGGTVAWASQINDKGQIVGGSTTAGNAAQQAFIYENGAMRSLGTLGGLRSRADGINNLGHIAGSADLAGNSSEHAFLYVDGVMTDLGNIGLLANKNSYALAINDSGDVIGRASSASGSLFFIYSDGVVQDLSTLLGTDSGWTIQSVADINASGQIALTALKDGISHAIRLDPVSVVPEPATYGMLGLGLLMIAARARRK